MEKKDLLGEFGRKLKEDLAEKGYASFLEGELAQLRIQCLTAGATEKEIVSIEDPIVDEHYRRQGKGGKVDSLGFASA